MGWKVSDPMSERVQFIGLYKSGQRSMTGLCREFGISRKTGYKWIERFEEAGLEGLQDQSKAPHTMPWATAPEIQQQLLEARHRHPTWGPRKLKAWLENKDGSLELPAASTIGDLLQREGLIRPRRRRLRPLSEGYSLPAKITRPNEEWRADFKGEFRMRNGSYCYPLTITDAASRYLLQVRALGNTALAGTRLWFEQAFRQYGLPWTIRTDNGSPFASTALGRLSRLSVWWIRLGIRPVRGRPKHPQDNGSHERMHRTLKAETTRPPSWEERAQQRRFGRFQKEFNDERPHEALGQKTPGSLYRSSERRYPERLPEIQYPSHYEVRKVGLGGVFGWRSRLVFVSQSLVGEYIGLVEVEDGLWKVWFASMELGVMDEVQLTKRKTGRVLPMSPV